MLCEEVAVCAARSVRKVFLTIAMASQTDLARKARDVAVTFVTALARLVLRQFVQAG
jgi:hypothetical protein